MKYPSRWRLKGKLKVVLILLFTFSALFMFYQLLYYTSLNEYQSEENRSNINREKLSASLNQEALNKVPVNSKGETGNLPQENNPSRGKPIFSNSVLGVAPEYWSLYVKQQQKNRKLFTCFASGRKISWDKVNDDYCDCPLDGSDEVSTSACMNGRFFCTKSRKHFPEYIPSSRVNDGICDCCDGSDEYDTLSVISCKNRC